MMKGDLSTMIVRLFVVCLLLILAGCSDDPIVSAPKKSVKKVRPVKAKPAVVESKQGEQKKPTFTYTSIGLRDPFESLLKKETKSRNASAPKTPLEKFDLGQFRVQAILIGKGAPRAMVSAPDGKNYILKPGLKIGKNDGVIRDITKTAIVIEESTFDLTGNLIKGLQSITIPEQKRF